MIALDANIPIYAFVEESREHGPARAWFQAALNGDETIGLPLVTLLTFIRVTTNQRLFEQAYTVSEAVDLVRGWLELPNVRLLSPTDRHWAILADLAAVGQARGPLIPDVHLAALTLEHGATLATNDRGFARFPKLKVTYPLVR